MTNRFNKTIGSDTEAINIVADEALAAGMSALSTKAATATLTTAELLNGVIQQSGGATATLTTPTAAAIVAAMANAQAGSSFSLAVINANSGTTTLAGGTGVTLVGTTAVPTNKSQIYRGIVIDADAGSEAVSLIGILTAPV